MEDESIIADSPFSMNGDTTVFTVKTSTESYTPKKDYFLTICAIFLLVLLPLFIQAWRIINRRNRKEKQQQQQCHSLEGGGDIEVTTLTEEEVNNDESNNNNNAGVTQGGRITIERLTFSGTILSIIFAFVQSIIVYTRCNIIHVDDRKEFSMGFWSYEKDKTCHIYGDTTHYYNNSPYAIRIDPSIQYAAILDVIVTVIAFLFILRAIVDNAITGKVKTKGLVYCLLLIGFFHINSLISLSSTGLCRDYSGDDNKYICYFPSASGAYAILNIIYWFASAIGVNLFGKLYNSKQNNNN